jgi:hypothetical protein
VEAEGAAAHRALAVAELVDADATQAHEPLRGEPVGHDALDDVPHGAPRPVADDLRWRPLAGRHGPTFAAPGCSARGGGVDDRELALAGQVDRLDVAGGVATVSSNSIERGMYVIYLERDGNDAETVGCRGQPAQGCSC